MAVAIAFDLGVPLGEISALLATLPAALPRRLASDAAGQLAERLSGAGAELDLGDAPPFGEACATHPRIEAGGRCTRCAVPICGLCLARAAGAVLCPRCARRRRLARGFYRLRVAVLLAVLGVVVLYALADVRRRRARNDWRRTLNAALVLVRAQPVDGAGVEALRSRLGRMEQRLDQEMRRYRPTSAAPFRLALFGPVDSPGPPPALATDGLLDLLRYNMTLERWCGRVDRAAGLKAAGFDARVYVVVRPPVRRGHWTVEGVSQEHGRIGLVAIELDAGMADLALFVGVHELMHTLGATDKYDAWGQPLVPQGLAEPDLVPRYPQRFTELMARHRPLSPERNALPESIDDLRVGEATAREIGWLR